MRHCLLPFLAAILALSPLRALAQEANPVTREAHITFPQPSGGVPHGWVIGSLPCPEGTVYSQPYTAGTGMDAVTRSDIGYQAVAAQLYQSFSGNTHPIEGVQVFGTFLNKEFRVDDTRLHLDADGNMTKPLKLCVAFYEIKDGYPDKEVYRESMEVYGEKTKASLDNRGGDSAMVANIYAFTLHMKEKVRMESGYVSVWSEDTSEDFETAFSLVGDSGQPTGICLYTAAGSSNIQMAYATFNFCFLGNANESLAQRGIKLNRVLGPQATETGKYAKVQVELKNYGVEDIRDATLNLYEGDQLLATETVDANIWAQTSYKYTFKKRIDCSASGTQTFTIENATPGDEGYADKRVSFSVAKYEGTCTSGGSYTGAYKYITCVDVGSIHNESAHSTYSDFRNLQTDITIGQTLTLSVQRMAANGDYNKVWVDWNDNGLFDDPGEFIGSLPNGTADISIPEGAEVSPGPKTLRIVLCDHDVSPCEQYQYGETEDYTLNVVRPDNSAALMLNQSELIFNGSGTQTVFVGNNGSAQLNANLEVRYELPLSADVSPHYQAPATRPATTPEISLGRAEPASAASARTTAAMQSKAANGQDGLTLSYAKDYYASTGANATYVSYAHFYPGKSLEAIKGMKLSAIDVYIASTARKSFVAVWKANGTQYTSETSALVKQQFTPTANGWNHVVLDTPVTIDGSDLFIGCALEGCIGISYLVGTDDGAAKTGFGDLISTDNSGYWWSLADLGSDVNVLIRATFSGERTQAVDWLQLDKSTVSIGAGDESKLNVTANALSLEEPYYDAAIKITSNDPLAGTKVVPVYLDLSTANSVSLMESIQKAQFRTTPDRRITVLGNKTVSLMALYTVDGRQLAMNFGTNTIGTGALRAGIYVVRAVFDDNTSAQATICVR